jgi:hypothetical protein
MVALIDSARGGVRPVGARGILEHRNVACRPGREHGLDDAPCSSVSSARMASIGLQAAILEQEVGVRRPTGRG